MKIVSHPNNNAEFIAQLNYWSGATTATMELHEADQYPYRHTV